MQSVYTNESPNFLGSGPEREIVKPLQKEESNSPAGGFLEMFVGLVKHVGDMSLHISRFLEYIVLVCWLYHSPMFGSLRGRSRTQPMVFNPGVFLAGDARRAHLAEAATGRSHKVAIAMFI